MTPADRCCSPAATAARSWPPACDALRRRRRPGQGSAALLLAGPALVCVALVSVLRARSLARRLDRLGRARRAAAARGPRAPHPPPRALGPQPPLLLVTTCRRRRGGVRSATSASTRPPAARSSPRASRRWPSSGASPSSARRSASGNAEHRQIPLTSRGASMRACNSMKPRAAIAAIVTGLVLATGIGAAATPPPPPPPPPPPSVATTQQAAAPVAAVGLTQQVDARNSR